MKVTWRQCFVLFLAIWVCTNRQESFYYIFPHHNVLLKNERHSRLINIQHFFTFYSSGIYTFIQYNCINFQLKIFLPPQSSQVSSSTYSVDKISHWRKKPSILWSTFANVGGNIPLALTKLHFTQSLTVPKNVPLCRKTLLPILLHCWPY